MCTKNFPRPILAGGELPEGCSLRTQASFEDTFSFLPIVQIDGVPFEMSIDETGVYLEHAAAGWGGHGPTLEAASDVVRRVAHEMLECHELLLRTSSYAEGIRTLAQAYRDEFPDECSCRDCDHASSR